MPCWILIYLLCFCVSIMLIQLVGVGGKAERSLMKRVKGFELQEQFFLAPLNCGTHSMSRWSMLRNSSHRSSLLTHKIHQVEQAGRNIFLLLSFEGFDRPTVLTGEVYQRPRQPAAEQNYRLPLSPPKPQVLSPSLSRIVTFEETVPWDSTWAACPLYFLGNWSHH